MTVEYQLWTELEVSCYSSTLDLDGSVLTLTCENNTSRSIDEQILHLTCHSNGSWIPDPAQFTCSSFTTMPTGAITYPRIERNNDCIMSFFWQNIFFSNAETSSIQIGIRAVNLIAIVSSIINIIVFAISFNSDLFY